MSSVYTVLRTAGVGRPAGSLLLCRIFAQRASYRPKTGQPHPQGCSLTGCPARAVPCCGLGTVAEHGDAQVYRGGFSAVLPDRSKHPYRNSRSYCLWWAGSAKPRKIDPAENFQLFAINLLTIWVNRDIIQTTNLPT